MASTVGSHIEVGNSALGSQIKAAIATLDSASQQIRELKSLLDKLTAGGTVPANLESLLSLTAGDGATLYTDIANLNANIVAVSSIQDAIFNLKSIS